MSSSGNKSVVQALEILRRILDTSSPGAVIKLPIHQARLLATLGPHELGELSPAIKTMGPDKALQKFGLKGRRIIILGDDTPDFIVE
jgi:hypothetical protein